MCVYGRMRNSELNRIYSKPHCSYQVLSDDKPVIWTTDKSVALKVFSETDGNYVELIQLKNGEFFKTLKEKEKE